MPLPRSAFAALTGSLGGVSRYAELQFLERLRREQEERAMREKIEGEQRSFARQKELLALQNKYATERSDRERGERDREREVQEMLQLNEMLGLAEQYGVPTGALERYGQEGGIRGPEVASEVARARGVLSGAIGDVRAARTERSELASLMERLRIEKQFETPPKETPPRANTQTITADDGSMYNVIRNPGTGKIEEIELLQYGDEPIVSGGGDELSPAERNKLAMEVKEEYEKIKAERILREEERLRQVGLSRGEIDDLKNNGALDPDDKATLQEAIRRVRERRAQLDVDLFGFTPSTMPRDRRSRAADIAARFNLELEVEP